MKTYSVLVENLNTGRRSVAEWTLDSYREELRIDGEKVPIGRFWAVLALDKAGILAANDAVFLDSVDPLT
jgi:hypothetical protein